ncbi:MAG: hypothetical protein JOZ47_23490 [Kutzneria sp.]|nr:hypothetical protein [Kutzneria sp.]MBV9848006.1 hypothetical protein [Kutzneria sp.]
MTPSTGGSDRTASSWQEQGQPSTYGGLGVYGPPQPAAPARRSKPLLLTALTAVVVVGGVGTAALLTPHTSTVRATALPVANSAPKAPALKPLSARNPNWHVATSNARSIAYEVPKNQWKVEEPGTVLAVGDENSAQTLAGGTGAAVYMEGFCPGHPDSQRAMSVVNRRESVSPEQAAPDYAQHWADVEFLPKRAAKVGLEPVKQIMVDDGKTPATLAIADIVTPASGDPCAAKTQKVYVAARPATAQSDSGGSVFLVLAADQGVPGALSEADAMKILTSMRPDQ